MLGEIESMVVPIYGRVCEIRCIAQLSTCNCCMCVCGVGGGGGVNDEPLCLEKVTSFMAPKTEYQ